MRSCVRPAAVVVLCFSLTALGCGSSLKGKIEGKWKVVSIEGEDMKKDMPPDMDIYPIFEFRADGVMTMDIGSSDPKAAEAFKALMGKTPTCKYKVLSGDEIEITELPKEMQSEKKGLFTGKDSGKAKVTITGDDMTFSPEGGKPVKLSRIK